MSDKILASQQKSYDYIHKTLEVYTKSNQTILPHFILSGSTGTGKTMLIKHLSNKFGIPVLDINGAQITADGMQGASLSKLLVPLTKLRGKPCIVLVDEFDKIFFSSEAKAGVQQEMLHIISSQRVSVIAQYGHYENVKTEKVLWIFAGAFGNKEHVSPDYLASIGMEPELLGRVNLHCHVTNVDIKEILKAVDHDPLLPMYKTTMALTDKDIVDAKASIKARIEEIWEQSVIGYRVIQRVIHQYFLLNGEYPPESDDSEYSKMKFDEEEDFEDEDL